MLKYKNGAQIAVEIELTTVAGKLKNEATSAVLKLVPTINASMIEAKYEVKTLVTPAVIAKIVIFRLLSTYPKALKSPEIIKATTMTSSIVSHETAR